MGQKLVSFFRWLFGQGESAEPVAMPQSGVVEHTKLVVEPAANHCRTASPLVRAGHRHPSKVLVPTRAGDPLVAKVVSRTDATVTCRRLHQRKLFRATFSAV